jgi:hypothetical protein
LKSLPNCSLFGIGLLLAVGCGPDTSHLPKTVTADGIVTLDGKPVEGAQVVLVTEGENSNGAFGATDASGRFSLRAFEQKEGAIPGSYKVQISKTIVKQLSPAEATNLDGGEPLRYDYGVPPKYTGFKTSGLSAVIPDSGTTDLKFELSSK